MKPTINDFLDTRRCKKNGSFPIKITVYYKGEKKRYSIGVDATEDEYARFDGKKLKDITIIEKSRKVKGEIARAEQIISNLKVFSFEKFEQVYLIKKSGRGVYDLFEANIKELKQEGKDGNAAAYEGAMNRFKKLYPNLTFEKITVQFLQQFEKTIISEKRAASTAGVYLRHLKAIYNRAREKGIIETDVSPFDKYRVPTSDNKKKALSSEELSRVLNHKARNDAERRALDYWIFSFASNGMNIKDIALLKYNNLSDTEIAFERSKTKSTRTKKSMITVTMNDFHREILRRQANPQNVTDGFVFPILNEVSTTASQRIRIKNFNRNNSKILSKTTRDLNLSTPLTNLTARHSYATYLKREGAPLAFISESLGHNNPDITQRYLDKFDNKMYEKVSAMIMQLKKPHR